MRCVERRPTSRDDALVARGLVLLDHLDLVVGRRAFVKGVALEGTDKSCVSRDPRKSGVEEQDGPEPLLGQSLHELNTDHTLTEALSKTNEPVRRSRAPAQDKTRTMIWQSFDRMERSTENESCAVQARIPGTCIEKRESISHGPHVRPGVVPKGEAEPRARSRVCNTSQACQLTSRCRANRSDTPCLPRWRHRGPSRKRGWRGRPRR